MTDTLQMHEEFLREVRDHRERLEAELAEMRVVEAYHEQIVNKHSPDEVPVQITTPDAPPPQVASPAQKPKYLLEGIPKHLACHIAMKELGGRAKTSEVAEWLHLRGYARDLSRKVFTNSVYTAMNRKSETFTKVASGTWVLAAGMDENIERFRIMTHGPGVQRGSTQAASLVSRS